MDAEKEGFASIVTWLFSDVTLQEPTYKRLVLAYRSATESETQKTLRHTKEKAKKIKTKVQKNVNTIKNKVGKKKNQNTDPKDGWVFLLFFLCVFF